MAERRLAARGLAALAGMIIATGCESEPVVCEDAVTLEMKPACERCEAGLAADAEAFICSYECTFCPACTNGMKHVCPNCGGQLVARPPRATPDESAP